MLAEGKVPVVVLNACQSGAVGKELEASVATALLKAGCAAVVAMAYSVYAVAAAEFMAAFYESLFAGESVGPGGHRRPQAPVRARRPPEPEGRHAAGRLAGPGPLPAPRGPLPRRPAPPARPPRRRWTRPWTRSAPPRPEPRPRRTRWPRSMACSWAATTCSTSWRPPPGCSAWWSWPALAAPGRPSWPRASPAGGATPAAWTTRAWCSGTRSSRAWPASAWTG